MERNNADQPQSPPEFEKVPESDGNISSDADLKVDQSNQEMHLHPVGNQSVIPNVPSYGIGFMPTSASHLAQFDGPEAQVQDVSCLTNFSVRLHFFLITVMFFLFNWLLYSAVINTFLNSLASPQVACSVLFEEKINKNSSGICIFFSSTIFMVHDA